MFGVEVYEKRYLVEDLRCVFFSGVGGFLSRLSSRFFFVFRDEFV